MNCDRQSRRCWRVRLFIVTLFVLLIERGLGVIAEGVTLDNIDAIIVNNLQSEEEAALKRMIEEQLGHPSTNNMWEVILDRAQFIKDKFGVSVKFKFIEYKEDETALKAAPAGTNFAYTNCTLNKKPEEIKLTIRYEDFNGGIEDSCAYRPVLVLTPNLIQGGLSCYFIPSYISLAHELLHALLRLEYFCRVSCKCSLLGRVKEISERKPKNFHNFLLGGCCGYFQGLKKLGRDFTQLWGNINLQYEEMEVILKRRYRRCINSTAVGFVWLGETVFMREYYRENGIICWTHRIMDELTVGGGISVKRIYLAEGERHEVEVGRIRESHAFLKETFSTNNGKNAKDVLRIFFRLEVELEVETPLSPSSSSSLDDGEGSDLPPSLPLLDDDEGDDTGHSSPPQARRKGHLSEILDNEEIDDHPPPLFEDDEGDDTKPLLGPSDAVPKVLSVKKEGSVYQRHKK
jgi:hypothetical protein